MGRESDTLDSARGLLTSQLRQRVYSAKAAASQNAGWRALETAEEGFVEAYQEAWREAAASWNVTDPEQHAELSRLILEGLERACVMARYHFQELAVDEALISSHVEAFQREFSLDAFLEAS